MNNANENEAEKSFTKTDDESSVDDNDSDVENDNSYEKNNANENEAEKSFTKTDDGPCSDVNTICDKGTTRKIIAMPSFKRYNLPVVPAQNKRRRSERISDGQNGVESSPLITLECRKENNGSNSVLVAEEPSIMPYQSDNRETSHLDDLLLLPDDTVMAVMSYSPSSLYTQLNKVVNETTLGLHEATNSELNTQKSTESEEGMEFLVRGKMKKNVERGKKCNQS
jgi:hypothetical protein